MYHSLKVKAIILWLLLPKPLETDDSKVDISKIYQQVATIKNIPLHALEDRIEENFKRVFTKWTTG